MAEAVEDSCQTSSCSTLDSESGSDLKEDLKIPGYVDTWDEIPQLIKLRTKLRTEINNTETRALALEQEICENRVKKEKILCTSCGLVREPRQRKIAELRLMHKVMLKSKPKHLLCVPGIISRLETMILEGFLDSGSTNKKTRCRNCRQDNEATMKGLLISEFIDILEDQEDKCATTDVCSMTEACCTCLCFVQLCLKKPEKFIDEYLRPKKGDTANVSDKPSENQELSNVTTKPDDESSSVCSQEDTEHSNVDTESDSESSDDNEHSNIVVMPEAESSLGVKNNDIETKKLIDAIQSEYSNQTKILTGHLNTLKDQLKNVEDNQKKLRSDLSYHDLKQSRSLNVLQTGVDRLKQNQSQGLARDESSSQYRVTFRGRSWYGRGPGPRSCRGNGESVQGTENEQSGMRGSYLRRDFRQERVNPEMTFIDN